MLRRQQIGSILDADIGRNDSATALVTFNVRDYGEVPSHFGRGTSTPANSDWEDQAMKETRTYPLRLPRSLREAVEQLSREDQTSINQFVVTAVAEKVSALRTARFFAERKARVDFAAFDKIMRRRGGKAPREGDEMPPRTT